MKKIIVLFFVISLNTFSINAQNIKPFQDGDRAVFLGNSITHAGFYESYIWLYYMTHFPDKKVYVFNGGSGGDIVGQMNARFEDDILPMAPNIVILTFGMNDSGYFGSDNAEIANERVEKTYHDFELIQKKLKTYPNLTKIIMSSSPYDETQKAEGTVFKGKSRIMERITDFQRQAAKEKGWGYVDVFTPMTEINLKHQKVDSGFSILGSGRVHPGKGGYLIMAAIFLKNQGLAGKPVANVSIDAQNNTVLKSQNASIHNLKAKPKMISFGYEAKSLPYPIDSTSTTWDNPQKLSEALKVYPFIKHFNQEILKVVNLDTGVYELIIDGERIAQFSGDSLSKGINLALLSNTPQYKQAKNVMFLNDQRAEIEGKLREYNWVQSNYFRNQGMLFEDSQRAFEMASNSENVFVRSKMGIYRTARFPEVRKMWEENLETIIDKIYEINKPILHEIEINKIRK